MRPPFKLFPSKTLRDLAERRCPHALKRTMQPSGSQTGGPDTAPDPVRTAVAQAANTVRYRRDLRLSPEVLEAMSKKELILVNTALQACPTHIAASVDPVTLISKIRDYMSAHEKKDEAQLVLVNRLENLRNQLLLAPEAPARPRGEESNTASLCRSRHSVPPSEFLRALCRQDLAWRCDCLVSEEFTAWGTQVDSPEALSSGSGARVTHLLRHVTSPLEYLMNNSHHVLPLLQQL